MFTNFNKPVRIQVTGELISAGDDIFLISPDHKRCLHVEGVRLSTVDGSTVTLEGNLEFSEDNVPTLCISKK